MIGVSCGTFRLIMSATSRMRCRCPSCSKCGAASRPAYQAAVVCSGVVPSSNSRHSAMRVILAGSRAETDGTGRDVLPDRRDVGCKPCVHPSVERGVIGDVQSPCVRSLIGRVVVALPDEGMHVLDDDMVEVVQAVKREPDLHPGVV